MKDAGISVIVCCYNSANRIELTLEHLALQIVSESLKWEIILIDNNSSDNTSAIAKAFMASHSDPISFSIVAEPNPGLSHARNKGFEKAKYEIILMVDDDNSLSPNYVEGIYRGFENDLSIGMVGGLGIAALDTDPPDWFENYAYCFAVGEQNPDEHLYGAGLGLRMSALSKLRRAGFKSLLSDRTGNNLMSGGDTELCFAFRLAGYKLIYKPELTFKHHLSKERINWSYIKRLFSGFGQSKAFMEVYTSVISGKPLPKEGESPFWKDRASYLFSELRSDLPLLFLSRFLKLEGNSRLLLAIAKQGHLQKVKELKQAYYENYKSVYQLSIVLQEQIIKK